MKYSEVLLKLYDVVLKFKKQKDQSYVPSDLFYNMKNILYLEHILNLYSIRKDELNNFELQNFNELTKLDSKAKAEFKKEYEKFYFNGKIKGLFLRKYKDISDYISVVFINELGDELFNTDFVKLFNENIVKIYEENQDVLNMLKCFSYKYRELCIRNENIGTSFKGLLKEIEMLSILYKTNCISGLKLYDFYNSLLTGNEEYLSLVRQMMPVNSDFSFTTNLFDIFSKIDDSYDFFSNKYIPLFLSITDKNSALGSIIMDRMYEKKIIVGLILNKLTDKEFLDSITEKKEFLIPDKVNELINIIMDRGMKEVLEKHKIKDIYNYYKIADDAFEEIKRSYLKSEVKKKM